MRLILRQHLENWATTFQAKGDFPILIGNLVRATTPQSTFMEFPSGSGVFIGGWDGIVRSKEDREYVPLGTSLWEFGTTEANTTKANEDYNKRTLDPLGEDPSNSTFIFVTPTVWTNKETWRQEKIQEGHWFDVRVYDSRNLEEWLDIAPAVAKTFAKQIGHFPNDGILLVEDFWDEWSIGPKGFTLSPTTVTSGRENQIAKLLEFLSADAGLMAVRASSRDEAIAFIIASAKQFTVHNKNYFFSKSLIVESADNFRFISSKRNGLNIIAKIEERNILHAGVSKGHHVLLPLGPDDIYTSQDIITLPSLEKDGLINALVEIGISKENATEYSKESGRNITILKRLLGFQYKLDWTKQENVREIIPAMLLGRWDENKKGDIEILEALSGEKYEEYKKKIIKWKDSEASLFIEIGSAWRLTSPMDAWTNVAPFLLKGDFEKLKTCILNVLTQNNPSLEVEADKRYMASFLGKESIYSSWAREGLIQSLILIGLYGEQLQIAGISSPQLWIDDIIKTLLFNAEGKLWASLNYEMPLIAEASPEGFLDSVANSFTKEENPILEMFAEERSIIMSTSRHSGLLWALESLAWMPEYLSRSAILLAELASVDPGGTLSNRPINSLKEIFKSWHYQTFANLDERIDVLKLIAKKQSKIAWDLLFKLLPGYGNDVGQPTYKMRWRMFGLVYQAGYTRKEVNKTHTAVLELILSIFDFTEEKMSSIIEYSARLAPWDRNTVLDFIETNHSKIKLCNYSHWDSFRKILHAQNSHPNSSNSLQKIDLERYEKLYLATEPKDEIQKSIWLFNEHWPNFPEGYIYDKTSMEEQHKLINERRIDALSKIYQKFGLKKVKELAKEVSQPVALGDALAHIIDTDEEIIDLCGDLKGEKKNLNFIQSFLFRKSLVGGLDRLFDIFNKLSEKKYSYTSLAMFLISIPQSKELLAFLDKCLIGVQDEYWKNVVPNFHNLSADEKITGINQLIKHKRFLSAITSSLYSLENIPTKLIIELLEKIGTVSSNETTNVQGHEIGHLFEELDKRTDVDGKSMVNLEWIYLQILTSYSTNRKPKLLLEELFKNTDFFVDILKWIYLPGDKTLIEKEREDLSEEQITNRAKRAYELFGSINKLPGMDEDGTLDSEFLKNWIKEVREKASMASREIVADMAIGKILAKYPENKTDWPVDVIFEIIENINTDSIKNNFSSELFNKRGSSSRGVFDGGDIERGHAKYFSDLYNQYKNKFPIVAGIFNSLSQGYLQDAKRMDDSAEKDRLDY